MVPRGLPVRSPALLPIFVQILERVPTNVRRWRLRAARQAAAEDPRLQRGVGRIGVAPELGGKLALERRRRTDRAPLALADVDAIVLPDADDIELQIRLPVFADFEGGVDSLARIQYRQRFPAEPFEARAEIRVQLRGDELPERSFRARLGEEAQAGKDEAESEAQQRILDREARLLGCGSSAGRGMTPRHVPQRRQVLEIVIERALRDARPGRNVRRRGGPGGERHHDAVVALHFLQFLAQQELGRAEEGGVFIQDMSSLD